MGSSHVYFSKFVTELLPLIDVKISFRLTLREHLRAHKGMFYLSHSFLYFSILFMNFI